MNIIKRLIPILSVLVSGFVVYYLITSDYFSKRMDAMEAVSSNAIFVYETREPVAAWNQLVSQPVWARFSDIPTLKKVENQLLSLDSITGKTGSLDKSLKGHQFTLSLHNIGREEFDFLISVSFQNSTFKEFIRVLENEVKNNSFIKKRNYSGVEIFEYDNGTENRVLTYAFYKNVFVASYTSFLVEEAIRFAKSSELKNFKEVYSHLVKAKPKPEGFGIFRISSGGLVRFINTVGAGSSHVFTSDLSKNRISANLEVNFSNNQLSLEGPLFLEDKKSLGFSAEGRTEQGVFHHLISNRTATYQQYNFGSAQEIKTLVNNAFETKNTIKADIQRGLEENGFYDKLTGEAAFLKLEEITSGESDKILILKSNEIDTQFEMLKDFWKENVQGDSRQLVREFFMDREIFMIGIEDFPAHLFEGQFIGFKNTYISKIGDFMVIANNLKAMKIFMDDWYNDNTWGKSLGQKKFLERISTEAGYNLIMNVPRFWTTVLAVSSPTWKSLFQKYGAQFKSVNLLSLQVREANNQKFVRINFGYHLDPIKASSDILLTESKSIRFNSNLLYGPKGIQNFNDRSIDYLVQDKNYVFHLVSNDGNLIFSHPLEEEINSPVFQVDYYKNGKLQLLFSTRKAIYAFDRFGESLPDFPFYLPDGSQIDYLNLIDYDNTRDYRLFVADELGDLFVFDKFGNLLEGWGPKNTSGSLATAPAHHRIPGIGDFMVSLHKNGNLELLNRKGESRIGSSIRLGETLSTDYALLERGGARSSQLVTVNDAGEIVKVNFSGELTYRNQLLRPDRETNYRLVKDQAGDRFLFVVHEYNKISVLNSDEKLLFDKNIHSEDLEFQLFSFGSENNIFIVIDKIQEFIYLYNLKGELLNTIPISGSRQVEVNYSGSRHEYVIMAIHEDKLLEYKLPL